MSRSKKIMWIYTSNEFSHVQGLLRECLWARRLLSTLLLHTTCVRFGCTRRANCVTVSNKRKRKKGNPKPKPKPKPRVVRSRVKDWRTASPTLFVLVVTVTCTMLHQDLTLGLAPTQHSCMQPHFTPTSSPPTLLHLITISILVLKLAVRHVPLGLDSVLFKVRATLYIHSTHSINTRKHPTPTRLGKVYKRALPRLYLPPPSINERSSVRRVQARHRLASHWYPFLIHSSNSLLPGLYCLEVCLTWYLWHIKIWWRYLHHQCGYHLWYATIPDLLCVHVVPVLLDMWWWCINNSLEPGTLVHKGSRTRDKRRGFDPGAVARRTQSARVHKGFFFLFPGIQ